MTFSASIDSRKIISFSDAPSRANISVSNTSGKLIFTLTPASGAIVTSELTLSNFAGFSVPIGVVLTLDASLANGKAMTGAGDAVARAKSIGEDLSGYSLFTDRILLSDGASYTLTAAQAQTAQIGAQGVLGDLRSTNSNSKINLVASVGSDLSAIQLDKNDAVTLTSGQTYTLTGEQALVAKVGVGSTADLTACSNVLIKAPLSLDLSTLKLDATDVIELGAAKDYVLTSGQVASARVGANGTLGALGTAGAVTVRASANGEDLSLLKGSGIDVYELTAAKPYTLTAYQLSLARVGATGNLGNIVGSGQLTIKAGAVSDLTRLSTKIVTDVKGVADLTKSDVIVLDANVDYRLTSEQARVAKVGATATAKAGDLSAAGQITLVAGLTATNTASARAEDLSGFSLKGVDFYELAQGADFVLTSQQAKVAKIGSGNYGNLTAAGNITLLAVTGENLMQSTITGVDEYRLTTGLNYILSADQALKSRVSSNGVLGAYGDVSLTKTTVVAGTQNNLTSIVVDSNDAIALTAGIDYTLTPLQASIAKIDDGAPGALAKAGTVTIMANPKGDDLTVSLATATGYDTIVLTAGGKYGLTSDQAKLSKVLTPGVSSNTLSTLRDLSATGQVTIVANALGEDLSGLVVTGIKAIQLTSGKDYTLTADQALITRLGATGVSGDLAGATVTPPAVGKTGVITIVGSADYFDFTRLKTDSNDVLVLSSANNYRLSAAQAATAKIGADGTLGQLASAGTITVVADTNNTDLSKLVLDSADRIELTAGQNYTLTSSQLSMVRIATSNSLTKAGQVTVIVNAQDGDITGINWPGIDVLQLTASSDYLLRADQAAMARVGTAGALGDLSLVTGNVTLRVDAATLTPIDLTSLVLKDSDTLQLVAGSIYVLTPKQAAMATVISGANTSARGDLSTAGTITIRPAAAGADLTTQLANIQGIDRIELDPEGAYTLTDAQARIAAYGKYGQVKDLVSKSPKGILTVVAGDTSSLTDLQLDANDKVILQPGKSYLLSQDLALISQIGLSGTPGVLSNSTDVNSRITVLAPRGADLTKLQLDANDVLILAVNQRYTLTSAQASLASVDDTDANTGAGNFANAGAVRIVASAMGEDLSSLMVGGNDTLQLTAGVNYTITAAQAVNALIGAAGVKGKLAGAGVITVKAGAQTDLTALSLDAGGIPTAADVLQLDAGQNYILTSSQAAIAKVGASGLLGQLGTAGNLTLAANPVGEDLSVTLSNVSGLDGQDRISLVRAKNYTLTKDQLAIAQVGGGPLGDLTSAGVITLKSLPSGSTEDLSTVASAAGVDKIQLKSGVNTTLTDEQAAIAQLGSSKVQDLRGTEIITIKSNDQDANLANILTDGNDLIWLAANKNYVLNSAQVPRISYDGQAIASFNNVAGQFTLKANNLGEDLSGVNMGAIDQIQLTAGRNYTLTPEQARISTLGDALVVQNSPQVLTGTGTLYATPSGTQNYTTQVMIDTTGYLAGGTITMKVILGNGTSAGSYDLFKNSITIGSNNRPLNSLAGAYDKASDTTTNLSYKFPGTTSDKYIFGIEGNWFSPANSTNTFEYQITVTGLRYSSPDLSKAGIVNIMASADGDASLKSKLTGISGIDTITLTDAKGYTLSAEQALIAKIGTGTAGTLTSTGVISVDDTGASAGTKQNLTKLVLDTNDTLTLGEADYDLTSIQVKKAATSLAKAGVVNLWANAQGEDLFGIAATELDNIYLTASCDYTLGVDQLAKTKVGSTGTINNLTKAGVVTLKLTSTDTNVTALTGANGVKGVDQVQVLDVNAALLSFLRNATASGNTGSNATVDASGEWAFATSTGTLTYWNGSTSKTITLVGVSSVAADGSTSLKISY